MMMENLAKLTIMQSCPNLHATNAIFHANPYFPIHQQGMVTKQHRTFFQL